MNCIFYCKQCDKEFQRKKYDVINRGAGKFCSRSCQATYKNIKYEKQYKLNWNSDIAYLLGLIYADGNVMGKPYWQVSLYSKDKEIIDNTLDILHKNSLPKPKPYHRRGSYCLSVGSRRICRALIYTGIVPNKCKSMIKLKIPNEYFVNFLLGFFDGDGCWDKKSFCLSNGSLEVLKWVLKTLKKLWNINGRIINKGSCGTYRLYFRLKDSYNIAKWLYSNNRYCLTRKKDLIMT